MTNYVLLGLSKRRAELTGEADAIKARLLQIHTDTAHLDAVIRQFDPDYELGSIKAKRQRGPDVAQRGERSRALLDVLREAGEPIATAEIVRRVIAAQGHDAQDRLLVRSFSKRVSLSLARQERQGVLRSIRREGEAVVWEVVR